MNFHLIERFGPVACVLTAIVFVAGCDSETPRLDRTALTPRDYDPRVGVPDEYHFLYEGGVGYDEIDNAWKALPFTRIELERTGCYGACP
ncbi:hypothetical protein, partial [Rhodopirellula bahusiensis]